MAGQSRRTAQGKTTAGDEPAPHLASRWWIAGCLVGIAVWIGVTVFVASRYGGPGDSRPATLAFTICGAAFFAAVFAVAGVRMRQSQLRARTDLYDRLALTPVSEATIRQATRGAFTIGYVYLAFGVLVTAFGLAAIAADGTRWSRPLLLAMVALVLLWLVYMVFALRRVYSTSDALMAPLGLQLVATPAYVTNWFGDGRQLVGAVSYAGSRHGREISITHEPKRAMTVARGSIGNGRAPTSMERMAALTGESARCWRGVVVERSDGQVAVVRRGNGAGRWFLHDLLLVEAAASA